MSRRPSVIVFDVGNVLIEWDPRHLYRTIFPGDEARMTWFLDTVTTPAWNVEQDRGRPFAEAVSSLIAAHPEWEAAIRAYDERWHEMVPGEIKANVAILERVRARGRANYAITNFSREKWAEAQQRFEFLAGFDGVVVSAHERLLKPDPAIYRVLFDRYGLAPEDCVFVDDSAANIATARALGMHCVQFGPGIDVARALVEIGYTD